MSHPHVVIEPSEYVLGHADHELERLQLQSRVIGGVTQRLISEAGIGPGMKVLEIGCGAGDVTLLLAAAVGPRGGVVAFDRERRATELARARASAAGYTNIEFVVSTDETMPAGEFDAVFGRYVLIHQPNPAHMLRRAATSLTSGGILAFHEVALHAESYVRPPIELFREIDRCINASFRELLPAHDVGGRFMSVFEDAGLPAPKVFWESVVGDHTSAVWRWVAMNYQSMFPHIERLKLNPAHPPDVAALTAALQQAAERTRAQFVSRPQSCAWVRKP